jgi:hypothetical protein
MADCHVPGCALPVIDGGVSFQDAAVFVLEHERAANRALTLAEEEIVKKGTSTFIFIALLACALAGCTAGAPTATQPPPTVGPTQTPVPPTPASAPAAAEPILEVVGPDGSQAFTLADLQALPTTEGQGGIKSSTGDEIDPSGPLTAMLAYSRKAGLSIPSRMGRCGWRSSAPRTIRSPTVTGRSNGSTR